MKQLSVGDTAPTFWKRDLSGTIIDSNALDSKYTLLLFLRYSGCPFCNLAIYRLGKEYKKLQGMGCEVVAFIQSAEEDIQKNVIGRQQIEPEFPIISDQEKDLYKLYGVEPNGKNMLKYTARHAKDWLEASFGKGFTQKSVDGDFFLLPALFILDANNKIVLADYQASLYSEADFAPLYKLME